MISPFLSFLAVVRRSLALWSIKVGSKIETKFSNKGKVKFFRNLFKKEINT
jgi:hypothetical protein